MAHARVIHPARRERAEQQAALTRALQATQTTHDEVCAKLAALAADEAAEREAGRKMIEGIEGYSQAIEGYSQALKKLHASALQKAEEKEQLHKQLLSVSAAAQRSMAAELTRCSADRHQNQEKWKRHLASLSASRAEAQAQQAELRAAADVAIRRAEEAHDAEVLPVALQLCASLEAAAQRHHARLAAAAAAAPQGCAAQAHAGFPPDST